MVDEWASFAPTYHLHRAEELAKEEDGVKACYALSRSVLQAARVVVWKDARCTSSSYEKIVNSFQSLSRRESLPAWALDARNQNFDVSLETVREKLEPAGWFVRRVLKEKVFSENSFSLFS
ncbi:hypothetical protein AKJ55_00555 [candidate division MSBL1 archaeon SCGC-AAA382M17]|uniref:Transposase IS701-like DDE domain-containing protein n=1 Tax=candidate division MSBL1 archaeon SCGC-AAA382M17 TaxID=1698284 RepID=A0ABR5TJV1_9EURY|nr:hypothetical protein AKJ55_00555 [candidate division MSBL1 archaeon SCGC-AAA382M17]